MKPWIVCVVWLVLGCVGVARGATAPAEVEHRRGDFRFFVGPAPSFVVGHEIPDRWPADAPGADDTVWRVWLYDRQADRRAGQDHDYTDYAYQPLSSANLGDAGRFQVEFNPEYQRLVLHSVRLRRDGAWLERLDPDRISLARRESEFENDLYDGRVTAMIVLDDVRVGDVVRIAYTITGSNPILDGQLLDGAQVGWRSPLLHAYVRALYDPGTTVAHQVENGVEAPRVRTLPDAVEVVAERRGNAAIEDEGGYPSWYHPYPQVLFGKARSWADVVAWALPLYPRVDALPPELLARIDAWARLPDPHDRLRAALRAVQDEVRYFGIEMGSSTHRPSAPATTWARRYGDCKDKAYLLSTILARLGIESEPALVSTARGRAILDYVPSASAFNHVIVRARVAGATVWMDPTMHHQGGDPRATDLSDYGVALPVAGGTASLAPIAAPAGAAAGVATVERYRPGDAEGALRLEIETIYTGASADNARRSVSASRVDDMQRRYAEYYRKRFGDLEVAHAPKVEDDRAANTLKIVEGYLLKAPFAPEGDGRQGLDVFAETLDGVSRLPSSIARTGPVAVTSPGRYRHEIEVEGPPGWLPLAGTERDVFASPAFAFERTVDRSEGRVRVVYDLEVKARDVAAPAASAHLGQMRQVRDNLSARLRFQAPAPALGASERDARLKELLRGVLDDPGAGSGR